MALADYRRFAFDVLANVIAEERKAAKAALGDEVRLLRIELADTQATFSELRQLMTSERAHLLSPIQRRVN